MRLTQALGPPHVGTQDLRDRACAGNDPTGKVTRTEARQDSTPDDVARNLVGQQSFEPCAHFDPDLSLGGRDDEQDAIVQVGPSNSPPLSQIKREFLDRLAAKAGCRHNHKLIPRTLLKGRQFGGEQIFCRRVEKVRLIDDAPAQLEAILRIERRSTGVTRRNRQCQRRDDPSHLVQLAVPKSTLGALSAPAADSNGTLGLAP